jgi:arylsulfatase A-like enzyme/Tfp pilus assembly protein PilF
MLVVLLAVAAVFAWRYYGRTAPIPTVDPTTARPNVVLITIDTLRADRLRRGFTPAIDALAAGGVRFDAARTVVPLTLPSHVTIMTGALPLAHHVRENGVVFKPGPPPLARILHDAGYRTGGFVGAYVLNRVFGLAQGFDVYDDRVPRDPNLGPQLEAQRRGGDVVDAALAWLHDVQQPFFLWVHLYDPHAPYDPPAEFMARAGGRAYDGEVAYADAQVGRVVAELQVKGLLADTVLAVAGDHGEGLGDHGEQSHGMLTYDSTLRVPLIVAGPGVRPGIVDRPVSLVDLAPSLLTIAGVRPGGTAAPLLSAGKRDEIYAETQYPRQAGWHPLVVLADERWKLILSSEAELYDLSTDAAERTNLAAGRGSIVASMSTRVRELEASGPTTPQTATLPPDAAERLRALGYVSGSQSGPSTDDSRSANPARLIDAWGRFERALSDVTDGRARAALPVLEQLAGQFPDARLFTATYARALKDTGSAPAAVTLYRAAVRRWPREASLYHDLAVAARAADDAAEALRAEQAALALDGTSASALNGLGLLYTDAGRPADAAAAFERATEEDPGSAAYWANLGNARRASGALDRAEAAYHRALDVDPAHADAANGLGVLLVQRDRSADAIAWFERALAHTPKFAEARLNLGIAYQESGNREQAIAAYRRVLAETPPRSREHQAATQLIAALSK